MTSKNYQFYFIYLTKNIFTGKGYVGWHATNNLNDGYIGSGILLRKMIKKYGEQNFVSGIIDFYDKKEISEKEIYWIKTLKTHVSENGYNLTRGGEGGDTWSYDIDLKKQVIEKLKTKLTGKKRSIETKNKLKAPKSAEHKQKLKGPKSIEHKEKLKLAWNKRRVEKPITQETKDKISKAQQGKHIHNTNSKAKISKANSERIWSEESKEKSRKSHTGKRFSKEVNKKKAPLEKCIYCDTIMSKGNLIRYHNDNCKFKS